MTDHNLGILIWAVVWVLILGIPTMADLIYHPCKTINQYLKETFCKDNVVLLSILLVFFIASFIATLNRPEY